jgi:hypothetical protein
MTFIDLRGEKMVVKLRRLRSRTSWSTKSTAS